MQPAEAHIWKSTSEVQDYLYYKSCWIFLGGISIVIFEKKKEFNFSKHVWWCFNFKNIVVSYTTSSVLSLSTPSYLFLS